MRAWSQAASLRVQEASLTGESEAVLKDAATLPAPAALGDRLDMVFKGTAVAQGTGRAVVTATGMDTEMGSIAEHARGHRGGADAAAEGGRRASGACSASRSSSSPSWWWRPSC